MVRDRKKVGPDPYGDGLRDIVRTLKPRKGLEIGFGWHGFSANIFLDNCEGTLLSIDKGDWTGAAGKLTENDRFTFIQAFCQELLPAIKGKFDYIYIDGDHGYEGAKRDMEMCIPLLAQGGHIVLDDCNVPFVSAVDLDDKGNVIDGTFGVGQAADEVFKDWDLVHTHIKLANGGRVYARRTT